MNGSRGERAAALYLVDDAVVSDVVAQIYSLDRSQSSRRALELGWRERAANAEPDRPFDMVETLDGQKVTGPADLVDRLESAGLVYPAFESRAEIAQLLVRRSARRRGIAEKLMEHAEQEALAEGKTVLVLDTVTGDDAERLYERLGWTRVGVIPEYALYPDGRPCDTTVFFKRL